MQVDFDELIYQITLRFDSSITPAEARALSGTTEEKKDVGWLLDCLNECAIDNVRFMEYEYLKLILLVSSKSCSK